MKIKLADGSGTIDLKYLFEESLPSGSTRIRFRRHGKKITLRSPAGSDNFLSEYRNALAGEIVPPSNNRLGKNEHANRGTLRWLVERYYRFGDFKLLSARTQYVRRLILDGICGEAVSDRNATLVGSLPFAKMDSLHVRSLRDAKLDTPEAANSRIKALRQVFSWAVEAREASRNPARDVRYLKTASEGWHTWTVDEVRRYMERHPIGTKPHLVLGLLLFTGQRRSDVVQFGRQHVREAADIAPALRRMHGGRWLHFTQQKNRNRKPVTLTIPIPKVLEDIIAASPCGDLTFLVTKFGKPYTENGFGNWFKARCREAGLPNCSAHGLRKAGATMAAENGATTHQLMAIFGWQTIKQAEKYTRQANQKRLAASGMSLLAIEEFEEQD